MQSKEEEKKQHLLKILNIFDSLDSSYEQIEMLANLCLVLGTSSMEEATTDPKLVVQFVLDDIKKNGNTIYNSLAMQGITILEWLTRYREE